MVSANLSVPDKASHSYDLWDAPRCAIDPCAHAFFIACELPAIPMPAARANLPERRHPQMAYANSAPQRVIRLCDCPRACSSSHDANGAFRDGFIELKGCIHVFIRPSEKLLHPKHGIIANTTTVNLARGGHSQLKRFEPSTGRGIYLSLRMVRAIERPRGLW